MDRKILVVDDETDIREILQFNLENAGHVVDTAASAEEALEILSPEHGLILLELRKAWLYSHLLLKRIR